MDLSPRRGERNAAGFVEGDPEEIQERRCELARKPPPPSPPPPRQDRFPLRFLPEARWPVKTSNAPPFCYVTLARSCLSRLRLSARFLAERHFIS